MVSAPASIMDESTPPVHSALVTAPPLVLPALAAFFPLPGFNITILPLASAIFTL